MTPQSPSPEASATPAPDGAQAADGTAIDGTLLQPEAPPPSLAGTAEGPVKAAEDIKQAVSSENQTIGGIIEQLDSYAVNVGSIHISVWSALIVVMIVIALIVFARLASKLAHWLLGKMTTLDSTQRLLSEKFVTVVVWILAALIGLDILGIDLTALTVFSGAFGLALGFGLQKTFGNLISGIILLMDRSIKPGDTIGVNDGISNTVGVAYGSDMELAEKLMYQAAKETSRVLEFPPTNVLMIAFGASSVDFEVRIWITDPEAGIANVRSEVLKRLWKLFKENGVEIPFPQRDINLRDNEAFRNLLEALQERRTAPDSSDNAAG